MSYPIPAVDPENLKSEDEDSKETSIPFSQAVDLAFEVKDEESIPVSSFLSEFVYN